MAQSLLIYASHDGQTARIMDTIAHRIRSRDVDIDVLSLCTQSPVRVLNDESLSEYTSVLVGSPIRYGHHLPNIQKFIKKNQHWLNRVRSGFFSVNLSARKPNRNTPESNPYVQRVLEHVGWQPDMTEVFAGALQYSRYPFYDRLMIQLIMKITGGSTDTSKDIDYTDWSRVNAFADHWGEYITRH